MALGDLFKAFSTGAGKTADQTAALMGTTAPMASMAVSSPTVASQPNNPTVPSSATVPPNNPNDPAALRAGANGGGDASPLDKFNDLWKADPNAKPVEHSIQLPFDGNKVLEAAKGVDFLKKINPELVQKAMTGDANSMAAVIQESSQLALAQSVGVTTSIVNEALSRQSKHYEDKIIPDILRRHSVSTEVRRDNPLFDHPATAPMLNMLEGQLAQKYPSASAADVKAMAQDYLLNFSSEVLTASGKVVSDQPPAAARGTPQETDWDAWLSRSR